MNFKAHTVGGVLAGIATVAMLSTPIISTEGLMLLGGATIGGLLPDIDHQGSYLGSKIKPISYAVRKTMGHRGATHAPFVILLVLGSIHIATRGFGAPIHPFMIGIAMGMFSHIFLDSLTVGGIPWLYPFKKKKISFLPLRTGGTGEMIATILMSGGAIFLLAQELFKVKPL